MFDVLRFNNWTYYVSHLKEIISQFRICIQVQWVGYWNTDMCHFTGGAGVRFVWVGGKVGYLSEGLLFIARCTSA